MINYNNRKFKAISNSGTGEVGNDTIFHYYQMDKIIWGTYNGGDIKFGTITGIVHEDNTIEFSYQHVNSSFELMTGHCVSTPKQTATGKLQLHEKWQWTCKDESAGESLIEEI